MLDALVVRPPQLMEEPASFHVALPWILPTTILQESGIESRFFNVDFLRRTRTYQCAPLKDHENLEKMWRNLCDESHEKWKYTKRVLKKYEPDVIILIPHHHYNIHTCLIFARITKRLLPESKVVVCNYFPYFNDLLIANPFVDVVMRFNVDIEPMLPKLVGNLLKGEKISALPNLILKGERRPRFTRIKPVMIDLNSLPIPNRELVIDKRYYPPSAFGHILAGRGCEYKCRFCPATPPFRLRSPQLVVKEMMELYVKYRVRDFSFFMQSFTRSRKWALEVCNLIKKTGVNALWSCYANAIEIDDEIVKIMKEAGCWKICLGLESGSERVLKMMNKPLSLKKAFEATQIIKKHGIFLYTGFIIGFPGEEISDVYATLRFLSKIRPDFFILMAFVPHPGIPIFESLKRKGLLTDERYWEFYPSQFKLKMDKEKEERLNKIHKRYRPLVNLCERIIWRKIFTNPRYLRCKFIEYLSYLLNVNFNIKQIQL